MLVAPVLTRMLAICVRTVEIATPCCRAMAVGHWPLASAVSTVFSAGVRPWQLAKLSADNDWARFVLGEALVLNPATYGEGLQHLQDASRSVPTRSSLARRPKVSSSVRSTS